MNPTNFNTELSLDNMVVLQLNNTICNDMSQSYANYNNLNKRTCVSKCSSYTNDSSQIESSNNQCLMAIYYKNTFTNQTQCYLFDSLCSMKILTTAHSESILYFVNPRNDFKCVNSPNGWRDAFLNNCFVYETDGSCDNGETSQLLSFDYFDELSHSSKYNLTNDSNTKKRISNLYNIPETTIEQLEQHVKFVINEYGHYSNIDYLNDYVSY